jgi:hypothetical protein
MSEKEMINLARKLLDVANKVVGMVAFTEDEYKEVVNILNQCIQMLNDWLRKCEEGTLGAEKPA